MGLVGFIDLQEYVECAFSGELDEQGRASSLASKNLDTCRCFGAYKG